MGIGLNRFKHSRENTLKVAEHSYWYADFIKTYRASNENIDGSSKATMVILSAIIAILNACLKEGWE